MLTIDQIEAHLIAANLALQRNELTVTFSDRTVEFRDSDALKDTRDALQKDFVALLHQKTDRQDRKMLSAAFNAMKRHNFTNQSSNYETEMMNAVKSGFMAARRIKGGSNTNHVVASALYAVLHDQDIEEMSPTCIGALPWVMFAAMVSAFEYANSADQMLTDDELPSGSDPMWNLSAVVELCSTKAERFRPD